MRKESVYTSRTSVSEAFCCKGMLFGKVAIVTTRKSIFKLSFLTLCYRLYTSTSLLFFFFFNDIQDQFIHHYLVAKFVLTSWHDTKTSITAKI